MQKSAVDFINVIHRSQMRCQLELTTKHTNAKTIKRKIEKERSKCNNAPHKMYVQSNGNVDSYPQREKYIYIYTYLYANNCLRYRQTDFFTYLHISCVLNRFAGTDASDDLLFVCFGLRCCCCCWCVALTKSL